MGKTLDIKWYKSIDSTNMQAARELGTATEGTVWVADYQTAGRGQRGNSWESTEGKNLLFTVLLRPEFLAVGQQFSISQITALAVVKMLEEKGLAAKIKWPNDIYAGDKKICGILIEHSIMGANLSASILGIGINVNQEKFDSDAPNPTSLILELAGEDGNRVFQERREILSIFLSKLFGLYEELQEKGGIERLDSLYHSLIYRLDEPHKFIDLTGVNPQTIEGRIKGTNRYGCLLLELSGGEVKEYSFQQIRYII